MENKKYPKSNRTIVDAWANFIPLTDMTTHLPDISIYSGRVKLLLWFPISPLNEMSGHTVVSRYCL